MKSASISFTGKARICPDGDVNAAFEAEGSASVSYENTFTVETVNEAPGPDDKALNNGQPDSAAGSPGE